jgi:DNA-binding NarL/FixJ family response regulator
MQCARLVAEGLTERQIGRRMGISHETVGAYVNLIYVRLRLQSWGNPRVRLARWVLTRAAPQEKPPARRGAVAGGP